MPQSPLFGTSGISSGHDFEHRFGWQRCRRCRLARECKSRARPFLPGELIEGVTLWEDPTFALAKVRHDAGGQALYVVAADFEAWLAVSRRVQGEFMTEIGLIPPCRPADDWQSWFSQALEALLEATRIPCLRCRVSAGVWCRQGGSGGPYPGLHSMRLLAKQRHQPEEVNPWAHHDHEGPASDPLLGLCLRAERSQSEPQRAERALPPRLPRGGKQLADGCSTPRPPTSSSRMGAQ